MMTLLQYHVKRIFRRLIEAPIPRHINRRIVFITGLILCILLCIYWFSTSTAKAPAEVCVSDHFIDYGNHRVDFSNMNSGPASYVGNGYIGVDVSNKGRLLIMRNNSHAFDVLDGLNPIVYASLPSEEDVTARFVSDTSNGISKSIRCLVIEEECVCVYQYVYAHRTIPNIIVQEMKFSNPSKSDLATKISRMISSDWEKHETSSVPVYYRSTHRDGSEIGLAVVCSTSSEDVIISKNQEQNLRFICAVEHGIVNDDTFMFKRMLIARAVDHFTAANSLHWTKLDAMHNEAWLELNKASFEISVSKIPNSLNTDLIDLTKYALLSSIRAPLLENNIGAESSKINQQMLQKKELCYQGHSTLLTPSKLWKQWQSFEDIQQTINIWIMTLKHRGCMHLVNGGAHGLAQAFLLSLIAATFTHHHLEFSLDPADDLHRELKINGLEIVNGATVNMDFKLDSEFRPFVHLQTNATNSPLFACSGACFDGARRIGELFKSIPLKITKPPSPILFISDDEQALNQLKDTLHVIDVMDVPKHLPETIALHQHGENVGLPMLFWVVLVVVLISFHLFLFKLLYSEWKNSNNIPYAKFSKKMLLRR